MPVVRVPSAATCLWCVAQLLPQSGHVWAILVYDDADFVTRGRVPNSTTVPGLTPLLNASQLYMDSAKCVSQFLLKKAGHRWRLVTFGIMGWCDRLPMVSSMRSELTDPMSHNHHHHHQPGHSQADAATSASPSFICTFKAWHPPPLILHHNSSPSMDIWSRHFKPSTLACALPTCTLSHAQDDDWGITSYPLIPGHEVVGTVAALGANVQGLDVGQRCAAAASRSKHWRLA